MRLAVLGTRGFPNVQGGVEAHCEKLYPLLAGMGCDVTVFTRKPYVKDYVKLYKGVKLVAIDCPKHKWLEAMTHTFRGVLAARKIRPDILHIHAIGPSFLAPIARLMGFRVVVTNHGPDYKRKKWNAFAKIVLLAGEMLGSYFANEVICISKGIAENIRRKYGRSCFVIPNGVDMQEAAGSDGILSEYGLDRGKYILAVGRFVPEKGFLYLMEAFRRASPEGWKLAIAGKADHESEYSLKIKEEAKKEKDIVLTGFLSGKPLNELYSHAGMFILPSYYEGLPITLLEAASYGLLCLASDIPANHCIDLPDDNFFSPGDIDSLSDKIREFSITKLSDSEKSKQIETLRRLYDWDRIARKTLEIYKKAT